ncbi:HD domain-containing protein [Pseudenhygromyxa sp. WMMC2535]|uniref:HD domain-containing protein n=1 Tax=Pseudenhygromyxa sp. WMMC2535 TaxID=2712867 RepID=UPI0015525B67|nr:HD domain-containing protein [Pseudenhygromyxa sp. WMMC2535]NVB36193.1 HD domain-containing protein [Pseudenhygromyxa sp. WMMC2535]NVB43393.1 HD domain-containing protein [Pseudenhygromyxa sp. WMMC2535]
MALARQRARVHELLGADLVHSPWLRRLGRISFLGTLDEHPRSRRASTRLEHSLGVAALAADAAEALALPTAKARVFVAACLLHDVGHYPLSHAAEPAFAKVLGAGHHEVGRWIILGAGPIPRVQSLAPQLEQLDIDPAVVWGIIDRSPELPADFAPLAELLKAPINLDTLEGIQRAARDFRVRSVRLPERVFTWVGDELGISRAALPAVDRFWGLKDRVYDQVINLPSNILAEARLCELVAQDIDATVLHGLEAFDDSALRRRLGAEGLERAALVDRDDRDYELWVRADYGERVAKEEREPLMVRVRKRYYVDLAIEPEAGQEGLGLSRWIERYRHEKTRAWLVSRRRDQLRLPLPSAVFAEPPASEAPEI